MSVPLCSICIPCYKRVELVRNTLYSIYVANKDVPLSDYEVVISDNDPDAEIESIVHEFSRYGNFFYHKTKCEGFLNSYYALSYGKGDLLKLHNSQNLIRKGMLKKIIELAKEYRQQRPLIFHTNGFLDNFEILCYINFDEFMAALSYWSSWSGGMTIWHDDFIKIGNMELNKMFPHTSIMLTQTGKTMYIVSDIIYYDVQRVYKRGGHNKFEAFTVHYPSLLDECCKKKMISAMTKDSIFKALYEEYIPTLLFNKYVIRIETFEIKDFKINCRKFFPKSAYYMAWLNVLIVPYKILKRRIAIFKHGYL